MQSCTAKISGTMEHGVSEGCVINQQNKTSDICQQQSTQKVGDLLQGGPGSLPLYTEEWVEELLSRIFSILGNLEAPETRSDHAAVQGNAAAPASDSASFLLEGNSMFRYISRTCTLLSNSSPWPCKRRSDSSSC